jgi:trk system potassium uptake protein TrkA
MLVASIRRENEVMIARGNSILEAGDRITLIGLPEVLDKGTPLFDLQPAATSLAGVVIAGGGETGLYLAELLEKRGHHITLIERNRLRAEVAGERLQNARILHGDATDIQLLREERIGRADYFIALTGDDENNVMSSLLARELGVSKTACLIDRPDYTRIVEKIGIDFAISPRIVVANRVLALVKRGRISSVTLLEDGELEVSEYQAQSRSPVVGQALKEIAVPPSGLIGAVLQGGQAVIPRGDYIIKPGAIVIGVTLASEAEKLDRLFANSSS